MGRTAAALCYPAPDPANFSRALPHPSCTKSHPVPRIYGVSLDSKKQKYSFVINPLYLQQTSACAIAVPNRQKKGDPVTGPLEKAKTSWVLYLRQVGQSLPDGGLREFVVLEVAGQVVGIGGQVKVAVA